MTNSIGQYGAGTARVAVLAGEISRRSEADRLCSELGLPLIASQIESAGFDFIIEVGPNGLSLAPTDKTAGGRMRIDFVQGPTAYRRVAAGSTRQPLAKAMGLRQGRPHVFDATAGLGRDCFLLACLGCRVTAVERSPILAAMLNDALKRARAATDRKLLAVAERIEVISGDSKQILVNLPEADRPDVVYLDPMYVPRESSALAKKEMRILRQLVGGDEDAEELLRVARQVARKRIVVKRHLRAAELAERVTMTYRGRSVRYDVYLPSAVFDPAS